MSVCVFLEKEGRRTIFFAFVQPKGVKNFLLVFLYEKEKQMEVVKIVVEVISFMWDVEFWRMAVLWTLSLIFSYLKLFYQNFFFPNSKCYSRCSPKDSAFATVSVPRPVCIITGVYWLLMPINDKDYGCAYWL